MQGRPFCLYLETINAALPSAYVCTVVATAIPPHSIVAVQSETAEKVEWYMGIVVEPKEVEKARYINKRKVFRS